MDPKTVEDAISFFQASIKTACIEEAAGFVGKIISGRFESEPFWHPLKFDGTDTFISATQRSIDIAGYDIGFWLKEFSKGERDWNEPYPFNYEALLKNERVPLSKASLKKDETTKRKGQRTPLYNQPYSEEFRAKVAATPQPLMRDFQADPQSLSTILSIACNDVRVPFDIAAKYRKNESARERSVVGMTKGSAAKRQKIKPELDERNALICKKGRKIKAKGTIDCNLTAKVIQHFSIQNLWTKFPPKHPLSDKRVREILREGGVLQR